MLYEQDASGHAFSESVDSACSCLVLMIWWWFCLIMNVKPWKQVKFCAPCNLMLLIIHSFKALFVQLVFQQRTYMCTVFQFNHFTNISQGVRLASYLSTHMYTCTLDFSLLNHLDFIRLRSITCGPTCAAPPPLSALSPAHAELLILQVCC